MSISSSNLVVSVIAAAFTFASAGAFAQDRYGDDSRYDRYDDRDGYDYARVVDVEPLTRQVRVTTPQRECWDETRYDDRGYEARPSNPGGALVGAIIGGVIGHQIGDGRGRRAATAAGAVIGAAVGGQAGRRNGGYEPPPREYTVQRCETRYHEDVQERIDGYRVTYVYHGRRGVTELPYKPGDRIRVRVDVTPAE